jgi:catechol 2,3-dioxygenase-like lactoylglutathione lyase family enzyme
LKVDRLDHLVLTVKDMDAVCKFYSEVLGMEPFIFSDNRKGLAFGAQKINLHQAGHELEPKASKPTPGSADLCFITQTSLSDVVNHVRSFNIDIVEGPIKKKSGAKGSILSIYFRDPDGNLIEVSNTADDFES